MIERFLRAVSDTEIVDWIRKRMVKLIRVTHGEGINSKSLRLAVDPRAGRAASLLPDDIPFARFLGASQQMMSGEVSECKNHEPSCPA